MRKYLLIGILVGLIPMLIANKFSMPSGSFFTDTGSAIQLAAGKDFEVAGAIKSASGDSEISNLWIPAVSNVKVEISAVGIKIKDDAELEFGTGRDFSMGTNTGESEMRVAKGSNPRTDANVLMSWNINSAVIKSSTTAGLIGTTPLVEGEIYKITGTNFVAISTGTNIGEFGYITIGNME